MNYLEDKSRRIGNLVFRSECKKVWELRERREMLRDQLKMARCRPEVMGPYLGIGRLIKIRRDDQSFDWTPVLRFVPDADDCTRSDLVVGMFVSKWCATNEFAKLFPPTGADDEKFAIVKVPLSAVCEISSFRLKVMISVVTPREVAQLGQRLKCLLKWTPTEPLRIETDEVKRISAELDEVDRQEQEYSSKEKVMDELDAYKILSEVDKEKNQVSAKVISTLEMEIKADFTHRMSLLQHLGYVEKNEEGQYSITEKGFWARVMLFKDEILLTELVDTMGKFIDAWKYVTKVLMELTLPGSEIEETEPSEDHLQLRQHTQKLIESARTVYPDLDLIKELNRVMHWETAYGIRFAEFAELAKRNPAYVKQALVWKMNSTSFMLQELNKEFDYLDTPDDYPLIFL